MRVEKSNINPLQDILNILSTELLPLQNKEVEKIVILLAKAGVLCESPSDLYKAFLILQEVGVVELGSINNIPTIRKLV